MGVATITIGPDLPGCCRSFSTFARLENSYQGKTKRAQQEKTDIYHALAVMPVRYCPSPCADLSAASFAF